MKAIDKNLFYSTLEAARILGVEYKTVARWVDQGAIKGFVTPGGHRKIPGAELRDFLGANGLEIPAELRPPQRGSILVVDDEKAVRTIIARTLAKRFPGLDVHAAEDGYQAGKLVTRHEPRLVVLDLLMPGIDGFAVCADIKSSHPDIKVLAISGHDSPENRRRISEAGADAFLAKPFSPDLLCETIARLLPQRSRPGC